MDVNIEVSTQLSLIDALLGDLDKAEGCGSKKNEKKKKEEAQDAMPDSTTNTDKLTPTFHCGDDVLVPNKDGRYYLGTIVEISTTESDPCDSGLGVPSCLVKFGDGTQAWAASSSLKLLSAPPADDGRIMCVVCKRREGSGLVPTNNAIIPCDMCGRGYHSKCHNPPVESWIAGASWHCRRCVDQRYRVAAAENRALKRAEFVRLNGTQQRRHQQELNLCDTASTTSSTASEFSKESSESHCYCGEKSDLLAQMLMCCRCSRWFHQRCVTSLQYPLYAGDRWYIFACAVCNGGSEYLRRLELGWLELAHLALYNLTAYNARYYFDLDTVLMPYVMDNWHALQLPDKMWCASMSERRSRVLTALTEGRKRFKCGREMKKRATIWGLRVRRPPQPPHALSTLAQGLKDNERLTDAVVRRVAPRLRFLPPAASHNTNNCQAASSGNGKSSFSTSQRMIVPIDSHWLNLMMGKRFHENLNSQSENDSLSSYESKQSEAEDKPISPSEPTSTISTKDTDIQTDEHDDTQRDYDSTKRKSSATDTLVPCSVKLDKIPKKDLSDKMTTQDKVDSVYTGTHTSKIATMNLELSKLSTKNIIEHSKIMSLQHMHSIDQYYISSNVCLELESSGDETSSRGTLDTIIPPLKDFQGKNNPFLMQNKQTSSILKKGFSGKVHLNSSRSQLLNGYRSHMPLTMPATGALVKPLKRQLSEKDLIIGPNGEIKRKKHRRPRKNSQPNQSNAGNEVQKSAKAGQALNGKGDMQLHGRKLRQRQERNYYENGRRSGSGSNGVNTSVASLQLSPHKNNQPSDDNEGKQLKWSVRSYFGAETRVKAGESFKVYAKRTVSDGQVQYLIDWDTST